MRTNLFLIALSKNVTSMNTKFKTTLVLFIFITIPHFAQSQFQIHDVLPSYIENFTSIGDISYVITYDVTTFRYPKDYVLSTMSGNKFDYKELKAEPRYLSKDIQVLEIGNGISKTYSRNVYVADSSLANFFEINGRVAYPSKYAMSLRSIEPIEVYKNHPLGKYTITRRVLQKEVLLYEEPYPIDFNWQLKDDKKIIHSYECQKATTTFRGRTYEAWFAVDIPISDGPYKFGGLPGLILELRDSENDYVYNCIGIKECKAVMPIKFWDWKYTTTTKEKYNKDVKSLHDNFGMHWSTAHPNVTIFINSPDGTSKEYTSQDWKERKISYNPIELE